MAVVLITGCSSGFGLLAALQFARKGDQVYATMRNPAKAGELEKAKSEEKLAIEVLQLDVTDEASVTSAVRQVIDAAGRIDVLVNNAGIGAHGPVEETDDDEAKEIFETNFFGALRTIRAVLPQMREQKAGTIVNVSSLAGRVSPPFDGIYSASKFALEAATEALHYEVHPFGIRVALVEPGGFETNIGNTRRVPRRYTEGSPYAEYDQRFEQALSRLPTQGERADPQVVAEAIYNAVHDETPKLRYLVGQDAEMIGGLRRQMDDEQFEQTMRQTLDFWD
ncbi:MAG: SDR family oxidoreductase [Chloroflexi bacterium]|nr:SDR family oxidoreductase [Chloroflexota bacterium]